MEILVIITARLVQLLFGVFTIRRVWAVPETVWAVHAEEGRDVHSRLIHIYKVPYVSIRRVELNEHFHIRTGIRLDFCLLSSSLNVLRIFQSQTTILHQSEKVVGMLYAK